MLHCLDVAAVAERMIADDRHLARRLSAWLRVKLDALPATVALLVALHDIGKLDVRFQAKAPEVARTLKPGWANLDPAIGRRFAHGQAGFGHLLRDHSELVIRDLGSGAWSLLQAVTGHHGQLPGRSAARQSARATPKLMAFSRDDRAARGAWLSAALGLFAARGAQLPLDVEPGSAPVIVLAGLCSVADWIGSSVELFPYQAPTEIARYYEDHALPRAAAALETLALRAGRPSGRAFGELFPDLEPRGVQLITEALELPAGPALVVVEAQMGSGKTEAALSVAERLLARGDATGLYVALPTMATANAMWARLERDTPRLFEGEVSLVLAHGRRRLNPAFQQLLARGGPTGGVYDDEASVMCSRWLLRRKRALLGQVGAGTVDQAMLAVLRVRHHFIRAYGLAGSVVLLDEVHAYDAYMQVILGRLVEWLGAMGAPVVLLSATLPEGKRRELVEAYARGAGWTPVPPTERPPQTAPYPLVTVAAADGMREHVLDGPVASRPVRVERVASEAPEAEVLERLAEAARGGAMVAWIRNTVTEAQHAYDVARELEVPELTLFHARMRGCDRAGVEEHVLERYGKGGRRGGALLIATQVVEQSLDLDFDWLVTDLCPVDLLLQRAGRLHRHAETQRPRGFEEAALLVVAPDAAACEKLDFKGSGYVYDPATLGLTLRLLNERDHLDLPGDIRALVEAVYDPSQRRAAIEHASNREALDAAEARRADRLESHRVIAERACIAPAAFDPQAAEAYYGDEDEDVQALTRLGDSTTLLPVLWDGEDGAPLEGGEPWVLDPTRPEAWQAARHLVEQTVSVPAYPGEAIDRGARARGEQAVWDDWCKDARQLLGQTGLGKAVLVPMRPAEDGGWRGAVVTTRGRRRRLAYSLEKGLWFRKDDEA